MPQDQFDSDERDDVCGGCSFKINWKWVALLFGVGDVICKERHIQDVIKHHIGQSKLRDDSDFAWL